MTNLKIFTIDNVINTGIIVPEIFNYDHFGFYKKKIYGDFNNSSEKGLLISTEYYENREENEFQNLLIKEEYIYHSEGILIIGKTTNVKWYDIENNVGYEKTFYKEFNPSEIIETAINRRNYLINYAKIYCVKNIPNDIFDYLNYLKNEIDLYIQGYTDALILKIQSSVNTKPYITESISNQLVYILGNLS
jgi:hypothetical protein